MYIGWKNFLYWIALPVRSWCYSIQENFSSIVANPVERNKEWWEKQQQKDVHPPSPIWVCKMDVVLVESERKVIPLVNVASTIIQGKSLKTLNNQVSINKCFGSNNTLIMLIVRVILISCHIPILYAHALLIRTIFSFLTIIGWFSLKA